MAAGTEDNATDDNARDYSINHFSGVEGGLGSIEGRPSTSPTPHLKTDPKTKTGKEDIRTTSVLFVEQTRKGELAANLRQVGQRLQELTGFHIKVVERGGSKLSQLLANTSPWAVGNCGRQGCVTCEQGGDKLPPCTKRSILYESTCLDCNPPGERRVQKWR